MKERFNRSLKEAVEAKTLLDQQQGAKVSEVEDKAKEAQNPVYADATRSLKRNQKVKADTIKVEAEPKHEEKPKKPKMVPGAKKLKLDESLFESHSTLKDNIRDYLRDKLVNVFEDELAYEIDYAFEEYSSDLCADDASADVSIRCQNAAEEYIEATIDLLFANEAVTEKLYQAQEVFTDEENKTFARSELGMVDKDKLSDKDRRMIARRKLGLDKKKVWIDPKDNWTEEEKREYARQELGLKKKEDNK